MVEFLVLQVRMGRVIPGQIPEPYRQQVLDKLNP